MAKGEVVIDELNCRGCGYCQFFCSLGCIDSRGQKFSPQGYLIPVVVRPEACTGCGVCGWMCPHLAIDVFRSVEP